VVYSTTKCAVRFEDDLIRPLVVKAGHSGQDILFSKLFGSNLTTGGTGQTLLKTSKVSNPKEYPKLINRNINHIPLQV
jgi:hypothetical protein